MNKCVRKNFIFFLFCLLVQACAIIEPNPKIKYDFTIDPALFINCNKISDGVYKFKLSNNSFQTLERITARTNNPNIQKVLWLYYSKPVYLELYNRYKFEIPLLNPASYTDYKGEANTIFAPLIVMKGDTVKVKAEYFDSINETSYSKEIIFILE